MDLQLKNKVAFISGSTEGIGFAIALGLAKEGAKVIINGPTENLVKQALQKFSELGLQNLEGIAADLATATGAGKICQKISKIDILINNLGIYEPQDFLEIDDKTWQQILEINVMSGIRLTRCYLKGMLKRNWGRIIFISSESGVVMPAEMIHYGVSKTMQIALARGLAELTKNTEVTVNSLLVGPTKTPGVERFINELSKEWHISREKVEKQYFEKVRPNSLVNRFLKPEEIANFVVYLASPLSSATNGAALRADGGMLKSIL